ncbi:DUF6879 family protein [Sphaerisporangium sp. NPDC051017]|uniref:DUF6879 family protein n=1 Tax=Sphaerisporangium sp. NPDC051017 TaxID=3154636 RepID=UPI00343208D5
MWAAPGGLHIRGKTVTDPALIERFADDVAKGEDETDIWVPDRLFPALREALDETYGEGRHGHGQPTFEYLVENTQHSIIRLELRDAYEAEPAFLHWKETGVDTFDWGAWPDLVRSAVARGVRWRRLRVISEPVSDYIRWEHSGTHTAVEAGEDIRWLPRMKAADLLLPGADCWVFDHRIIRWNFQRGDDSNPRVYTYSSDPRVAREFGGAFEMAWDRGIPHAEYKPQ